MTSITGEKKYSKMQKMWFVCKTWFRLSPKKSVHNTENFIWRLLLMKFKSKIHLDKIGKFVLSKTTILKAKLCPPAPPALFVSLNPHPTHFVPPLRNDLVAPLLLQPSPLTTLPSYHPLLLPPSPHTTSSYQSPLYYAYTFLPPFFHTTLPSYIPLILCTLPLNDLTLKE